MFLHEDRYSTDSMARTNFAMFIKRGGYSLLRDLNKNNRC